MPGQEVVDRMQYPGRRQGHAPDHGTARSAQKCTGRHARGCWLRRVALKTAVRLPIP
jgi:hypothetical protein